MQGVWIVHRRVEQLLRPTRPTAQNDIAGLHLEIRIRQHEVFCVARNHQRYRIQSQLQVSRVSHLIDQENLMDLVIDHEIDLVAFSYSDVPHTEVMHKASQVTAAGADFIIIGASYTMLKSSKKVVSVCAVRTG